MRSRARQKIYIQSASYAGYDGDSNGNGDGDDGWQLTERTNERVFCGPQLNK